MGLFGNRKPKLPDFAGLGLDALLQHPEWAYPISEAGIDPRRCEIVMRLAAPTVGTGMGTPQDARPAILFGQGHVLALAFPGEREVTVVKRPVARAALQTQRSGWFQVLFGPASTLDGFMFWGAEDNLKIGTAEGDAFGTIMSAFLDGRLEPGQFVGTPQSLASSRATVEAPAPAFQDPQDELRWKMVHSVHAALTEMMDRYQLCFEKAEKVEKAVGMTELRPQHEISIENFRRLAVSLERELENLLGDLRSSTIEAQRQWNDLLFLLPGSENDIIKIADWCTSHEVDSEVLGSVVGNGMFVHTNFGLTRESFWAENERVIAVMNSSGQ